MIEFGIVIAPSLYSSVLNAQQAAVHLQANGASNEEEFQMVAQ